MNFDRSWLFLIWTFLTWSNAAAQCSTQTLSVYFSSETMPILYAPNGAFMQLQPVEISNIKNVPFLALSKNGELLIPGWENPKSIIVHHVAKKMTQVFEQDIEDFTELTVDYATGNVYFISSHNTIGCCNLEKKKCVKLVNPPADGRVIRKNLALDPKTGIMYWINDYLESSVQMAGMDGSNPRAFLNHTGKLNGMALSSHHGLMFVSRDKSLDKIDLKTKHSEVEMNNIKATDLFYADCKIMFKLRDFTDEFGVHDLFQRTSNPVSRVFGHRLHVAIESTSKYIDPCGSVICKELCVLAEGATAQCVNNETAIPEVMAVEDNFEINWNYVALSAVGTLLLVLIIVAILGRCTYTKILSEIRAGQNLRTPNSTLPEYTVRYSNVNNNEDRSLL
ncbi:Vitellogenin receptor [Aphelenchoides bicaudatus]|nr:Vitellogenin receptor [Aphelenchoides bicaudatus]